MPLRDLTGVAPGVDHALHDWLKTLPASGRTRKRYTRALKMFAEHVQGSDLTALLIIEYLTHQQQAGAKPATLRWHRSVLASFFTFYREGSYGAKQPPQPDSANH